MILQFVLFGMASLAAPGTVGRLTPDVGRVAGDPLAYKAYDKDEARRVHYEFGECVVKRRPKQAEAYVLSPILKGEAREKLSAKMELGDCLSDVVGENFADVMMQFPGDTLSYSLAEPLVRRSYGIAPITDFKGVSPLGHRTFEEKDFAKLVKSAKSKVVEDAKAAARGAIFLSRFGECVVRTDPANSFALVMAEPGSIEDKSRMGALTGTLGACVPQGHTLSFDRMLIRGTIAVNYFRLAAAARSAKASTGAVN